MRRTSGPTPLNYQQQQKLWQHEFLIQNESSFNTSPISASGLLLIPENNHFTDVSIPRLLGNLDNRTSQNARHSRYRNQTAHRELQIQQAPTISVSQLTLSKKSTAIESRLKEEKFSEAPDQYIDLKLRDFHICANNNSIYS